MKDSEQASASNGGQRPSLNSGFLSRRGWPKRCAEKMNSALKQNLKAWASKNPRVIRLWVFGSFLTSDSPDDLDIGVELRPIRPSDGCVEAAWLSFHQRWKDEIQEFSDLPVHLCYYDPHEESGDRIDGVSISQEIEHTGVLIYHSSPI
jgi:predicted nucleotidyltransferase